MAQRQPTTDAVVSRTPILDAARRFRTLGSLLVLFSCSLLVGGFATLVVTGVTPPAAAERVMSGMVTSGAAGVVGRVLHAGTLGLAVGTWFVGFAFLVEGLTE